MIKVPLFLAAALASTATVTATVDAAAPTELSFRLTTEGRGDHVRADFRRLDRETNQWNSTFRAGELAGLDLAGLSAPGSRPVQFSLVREAGRVDCAGTGGNGSATGRCRFTPDSAFLADLRSGGISSVSGEDAYAMTAVGVRRSLVGAVRQARYPAPDVDDLIALAALGVDRDYIDQLAAAGYRPDSLDTLVQFKALGITPDYIAAFERMGMGRTSGSALIQFKALGIDADYVESFRRIGYPDLSPSTLVEFKALGVTARYVTELRQSGIAFSPSKIVQLKALGISPSEARAFAAAEKR